MSSVTSMTSAAVARVTSTGVTSDMSDITRSDPELTSAGTNWTSSGSVTSPDAVTRSAEGASLHPEASSSDMTPARSSAPPGGESGPDSTAVPFSWSDPERGTGSESSPASRTFTSATTTSDATSARSTAPPGESSTVQRSTGVTSSPTTVLQTTVDYGSTAPDDTASGLSQSTIIAISVGVSLAVIVVVVVVVVVVVWQNNRKKKRRRYSEEENVNDFKLDIHDGKKLESPSVASPGSDNLFFGRRSPEVDSPDVEGDADGGGADINNGIELRMKDGGSLVKRALMVESRISIGPMTLGADNLDFSKDVHEGAMMSTDTFRRNPVS